MSCPSCELTPGQLYYCPDCHELVKATNSKVYEEHGTPKRCKASGTSFQWLDYHDCYWSDYTGAII